VAKSSLEDIFIELVETNEAGKEGKK